MYWLRKWLESYDNCTFSTWKNKCLFNLLFWIPNSRCTFHYYGRGGTPPLPPMMARHWSLSFRILNNLRLPWKTKLTWNFSLCWNIFYHSQGFWATLRLPKKQRVPWKFSLYWIYFSHSGFLSNLCLPWKTESALKSRYWIYIFYHSEFWTTCSCP